MEWLVGLAGLWLFFQFVVPILLVGLAVYLVYRYMKSRWPEGRPVPYETPPEGLETPAASRGPLSHEEDRVVLGDTPAEAFPQARPIMRTPSEPMITPAARDVHVLQPHEVQDDVHVLKAHEEHPEVQIVKPHEAHPEAHILREDERR